MATMRKGLYPVIYQEHDGSWAWSIESGEAFEPGHRVHARRDGYPSRGDARKAMQGQLAELKQSDAQDPAVTPASPPEEAVPQTASSNELPDWAVVAHNRIVAIFLDETTARAFAQTLDGAVVRRVSYCLQLRD